MNNITLIETPRELYDARVPLYERYADLIVNPEEHSIEEIAHRIRDFQHKRAGKS